MDSNLSHSEKVVEDFKRQKIASSVLKKIHQLIKGFEEDEKKDRRYAKIGMALLLLLVGGSFFYFLNYSVMTIP